MPTPFKVPEEAERLIRSDYSEYFERYSSIVPGAPMASLEVTRCPRCKEEAPMEHG